MRTPATNVVPRVVLAASAGALLSACFSMPAYCESHSDCDDGRGICVDGACQPGPGPFDPRWEAELVYEQVWTSWSTPTLVFDSAGGPILGIIDENRSGPVIARKTATGWEKVRIPHPISYCDMIIPDVAAPSPRYIIQHDYAWVYVEGAENFYDAFQLLAYPNNRCPAHQEWFQVGSDGMWYMVSNYGQNSINLYAWQPNSASFQLAETPLICSDETCYVQSLRLDSGGLPHVLFYSRAIAHGPFQLNHAVLRAGTWETSRLPLDLDTWGWPELSPSGEITACYTKQGAMLGSTTATCVTGSGDVWVNNEVFADRRRTTSSVLGVTLRSDGEIGVLFRESREFADAPSKLALAWSRWNGASWEHLEVLPDTLKAEGIAATMRLGPDGLPHLVVRTGDGRVWYVHLRQ